MSTTTIEDKRTVHMHEVKARDLQAKITALLNIEKVSTKLGYPSLPSQRIVQDVHSCVEQLQTIEREVRSLQVSQKELVELKDHLDDKKIERNELTLRQEVKSRSFVVECYLVDIFYSVWRSNSQMRTTNWKEHRSTRKTKSWPVRERSSACNVNTMRW